MPQTTPIKALHHTPIARPAQRPHLRGFSAAVPDVRRADAPDRVYHEGAQIRKILDHIGVDSEPPRNAPARGPPLWQDCDAQVHNGAQIDPDWDLAAQPAPDYGSISASTGDRLNRRFKLTGLALRHACAAHLK